MGYGVSSTGRHFSAGLDVRALADLPFQRADLEPGRRRASFWRPPFRLLRSPNHRRPITVILIDRLNFMRNHSDLHRCSDSAVGGTVL